MNDERAGPLSMGGTCPVAGSAPTVGKNGSVRHGVHVLSWLLAFGCLDKCDTHRRDELRGVLDPVGGGAGVRYSTYTCCRAC